MVLHKNNHHPLRPRAIIFDCDGTLADTMPLHWRAWQVIARRHGFSLPEDRFYSLGGVPSRDILKVLSAEQGLPLDPLAVAREKEAEYLPLIAQVEPINTVVGVARENYGKIPLAVASGGTRRIIEQVLDHLGIRHSVPGNCHQRGRREPEAGAGHLPGGRPPPGRAAAVLPRLRGYGFGDAGDSSGRHGGGGCEGVARET